MSGGIEYPAPTNNLPIFDTNEFTTLDADPYLTISDAGKLFVKYPTAQGNVNLLGVNVASTATITGVTSITDATASTSTTTGALVVTGGIGVAGDVFSTNITSTGVMTANGNVVVSGNCNLSGVSSSVSVNGVINVNDGANVGTIDQIGTELTLSSIGNVSLGTSNSLTFKNDNTTQTTAYTGREIADDCDLHTFVWNKANPSNLRYFQSSTLAMNLLTSVTNTATTAGNMRFYPLRLIKGNTINGIAMWIVNGGGTPTYRVGVYRTDVSPNTYLCGRNTTTNANAGTSLNYVSVDTPTAVPYTGIYYIGFLTIATGTSLSLSGAPTNTYINYGQATMTNGVCDKAAQTGGTALTALPASLTGMVMTISTLNAYFAIW